MPDSLLLRRSVFVPYYKHFFDIAVAYLAPSAHSKSAAGQKKKKQRTGSSASGEQAEGDASDQIALWQLRFLLLQAFKKCFQYDTAGTFLDATRFQVWLEEV